MPRKHVRGAKAQAYMDNIKISAWFAMGREAYLLPSLPTNVHIVQDLVF
jgi:hypothetical protein